jgi:uncharacterized protein YndB with AHSA1/START domain
LISWTEIDPPNLIAFLHGESRDDKNAFQSMIEFAADGGATTVTMRTVFPTRAMRDEAVEKYRAVEGARQTLDNLANHVVEILHKGQESR